MLDKSELNQMSQHERASLARALTDIDGPHALGAARGTWRRRFLIGVALTCVVALAAWIGVLAVTLPWRYRAGGWSAAWVGFDGALLLMFAATAWAAWRRRQVLIVCLVVLAALLCCDAWFDTTLDWGTPGFMASLLLALVVELPLAFVALAGARRLLRPILGGMGDLAATPVPVPPLGQVPLFAVDAAVSRSILPPRVRRGAGITSAEDPPRHDQEA